LETNLQNLVESANTASDFIKKHKALDSDKKPVSDLYFSPYLRELQASINRLTSLRSTLTGSSIKTIADLGITSVNGQFLVDVDQFNSVTSNSQNFKEIDALFFDHFSGSTSVVGNGGGRCI
jgi:hypothetical protein